MEEEKKVKRIRNGTVIDHIEPGKAMRCLRLIDPDTDNVILIGMNVDSGKMGEKDFVKIEDYYPTEKEVNKISLIAPKATISRIENGEVAEKERANVPEELSGNIKCLNPKCVTNKEDYITPKYTLESTDPLELRCKYCDEVLEEKHITTQRFTPQH